MEGEPGNPEYPYLRKADIAVPVDHDSPGIVYLSPESYLELISRPKDIIRPHRHRRYRGEG